MARRTFDVIDLTEMFVHWEAGRSQVQISESLGIGPQDGAEVPGPGAWPSRAGARRPAGE